MSLWLRCETFRNVLTGCQSHQKFERVPAELPPVTQEIGDFSGVEEENPQGQAVNLSGSLEEEEDGGGISHASEVSSHGGQPQTVTQWGGEHQRVKSMRCWGRHVHALTSPWKEDEKRKGKFDLSEHRKVGRPAALHGNSEGLAQKALLGRKSTVSH